MNNFYREKENKATQMNTTIQPYATLLCTETENQFKVTESYVIINIFIQ